MDPAIPTSRTDSDILAEESAREEPGLGARLIRFNPALGNSHFRLFWLGMIPATLAFQMNIVAAPYAAFTLSGSATILGLVSLASGIPMMAFCLIGGVVADRFPRRRVLIMTQSALMLVAVALAVLSLSGSLEIWHLLVLSFLQGCAFAFNMPARQSYVAEIVGRRLLRSAVTISNAGMNFSRIAGPALAGMLIAIPFIGTGGVFATMALMYAIVVVSLFRLPASPSVPARKGRPSARAQLVEGLAYVRSSPVILALLGMGFIATFIGMPYQTLMTVFSERVFDAGPGGLGALTASYGVGAFIGSLIVAGMSGTSNPAMLQLGFGVGFGVTLVAFALSPSLFVAMGCLVAVGFLSAAYTAINNTLIMSNARPELYGRVMSVYMFTFASTPLGAMPLAWLSDYAGAPLAVAVSGVLVAIAVAAVALRYPAYREIR